MVTLDDVYTLFQNAYENDAKLKISFMDNEFQFTKYPFENDNYMPVFAFKNNNLFIADVNGRLRRINIITGEIDNFCWEEFNISVQVSTQDMFFWEAVSKEFY